MHRELWVRIEMIEWVLAVFDEHPDEAYDILETRLCELRAEQDRRRMKGERS